MSINKYAKVCSNQTIITACWFATQLPEERLRLQYTASQLFETANAEGAYEKS